MNGVTILARNAAVITGVFALFVAYVLLVGVFLTAVRAVLHRHCGRSRAVRSAVAALHIPVGGRGDPRCDPAAALSPEEEAAWVTLMARLHARGGGQ